MSLSAFREPGDLEVEILMSRESFAGSFLVVEGDDDWRFWRPWIDAEGCNLVIGGGKLAVVEALRRLDGKSFQGAIGIVDSDLDRADAVTLPSVNLVTTYDHDLEAVLLRTTALERVLAELGDRAKIARFEAAAGLGVREALLARALPIGRLRWLSQREGLGIAFTELRHRRVIDELQWQINEAELLRFAAERCRHSPELLAEQLQALPACDPWALCQGHDLVHLLTIGLRGALGSLSPQRGPDSIAMLLRAGAQERELEATELWRGVRAWEQRSSPYRVLRPAPS